MFLYGEHCLDRFEEIVGTPFLHRCSTSSWTPTGSGWRFGDREILCLALGSTAPLEETVVGSGM